MTNVGLPSFSDSVDLRYFIEPLQGSAHAKSYLDRFPDALYNKSPDSHFMRFMYALLGPVGVGWLKAELLELRLQLEEAGLDLFNLESFYGDPFSFGRILTEDFTSDISGLLPSAEWATIRAQDEAYRSRAIQFMNAARLGTSPEGMRLAATSGIGQECQVIENYQYLFDAHSDDPLGLPHYGRSFALGEFIIIPRPAISRTQQQTIDFEHAPKSLGSNPFVITVNGYSTAPLSATATAADVEVAVGALPSLRSGHPGAAAALDPQNPALYSSNVRVSGGPAPLNFTITFIRDFSNQPVPQCQVQFYDGVQWLTVPVLVETGGILPNAETVVIADADRHHMQVAIDYLRPVASYPSFRPGRSTLRPQIPSTIVGSSGFAQVARFVTGSSGIPWPATDNIHWIVTSTEVEAPGLQDGASENYTGFHNISSVVAYGDAALEDPAYLATTSILANYNSLHVGPFPEMSAVMPYFTQFNTAYTQVFGADQALADYPEPLTISAQTSSGAAFINGVYPADYMNLQGVPPIKRHDDQFWASRERPDGTEYLEIDLGTAQAVNYITLEITRKPVTITVDYDLLDRGPARTFGEVTPIAGFPPSDAIFFNAAEAPWQYLELYFNDGSDLIFTRFIRLRFTRRADDTVYGRFLYNTSTQTQTPWSIDVRNIRIGRNVAPSAT